MLCGQGQALGGFAPKGAGGMCPSVERRGGGAAEPDERPVVPQGAGVAQKVGREGVVYGEVLHPDAAESNYRAVVGAEGIAEPLHEAQPVDRVLVADACDELVQVEICERGGRGRNVTGFARVPSR